MTPAPPSPQPVHYKDTLNLPVTGFPMKAGAAQREPEIQAMWDEWGVYERVMAERDPTHRFLLHDGPPYLSADKIHIGTALNKILKDIVIRYHAQQGYYSPYVPGYDGHGLPIENAVVKTLKDGRNSISPLELRKRCRAFAEGNLKGQEAHFRRLGVWGDWEHPYVTIDAAFEATQIRLFAQMYQDGYVYKGLKPVYWCPSCETALADAEVEYADHKSWSLYVRFPIEEASLSDALKPQLAGAAIVIWTTTPWTLPANLALSVHPDFEYVVIDTPAWGRLLVAKGLLEAFSAAVGLETVPPVLATVTGSALQDVVGRHPFIERESPVLLGTHVTLEAGTGIVHTAPGHGMEDYTVVQHYNHGAAQRGRAPLPILSPVDSRGKFTAEAGADLEGQFYAKANPVVVEMLEQRGQLLKASQFAHSYPHCWRCHNPVIYRATEQWFISVDKCRANALEAIRGVDWIPARGEARITSMVEGRTDWCISRQRVWGVPIPVFTCGDCGEVHLNDESIAKISALFEAQTSDAWWDPEAMAALKAQLTCTACGSQNLTPEMDIMDVWFDSGVTHTAVVEARSEQLGHLPVELYLEGSDQHRGWFQSSLLTSVMLRGQAPYKAVLTHGFVLDAEGRKMSKSLGNVIEPQTVMQQYGADILRLWVASVDYSSDVRIGPETLAQLAEVYKKVRNTIRYLMGNLHDFDPQRDRVPVDQLSLLDRYTLGRLRHVVQTLTDAFERYEFHRFYQVLQQFCVVDLSAVYFDVAKDTLYCDPRAGHARRSIQTVLDILRSTLVRLLVPVMPHLAEDIWQYMPEAQRPRFGADAPVPSVILTPWPTVASLAPYLDGPFEPVDEAMAKLLALKDTINKLLEKPRADGHIGSSLEVAVTLHPRDEGARALLAEAAPLLGNLLIVSQITVAAGDFNAEDLAADGLLAAGDSPLGRVEARRAAGDKCARCWKYSPFVGHDAAHPTVCERCLAAVTA